MIYLIPLPYYDDVIYDNPNYYRRIIPPPLARYGSPAADMIPPDMVPNGGSSSDDIWFPSYPPNYLPFPDPAIGGEVQIIPLD